MTWRFAAWGWFTGTKTKGTLFSVAPGFFDSLIQRNAGSSIGNVEEEYTEKKALFQASDLACFV